MKMGELSNFIKNPDVIIRNKDGRLNSITVVGTNNNRFISIELNTVKDINSKYNKYNLVVFALNSKDKYIDNLINRAVSIEYEKEDLPQVNRQLHESLEIINDKSSSNTVPLNDTTVNTNKYAWRA